MAPMNTKTAEVLETMSIFNDERNYRPDEISISSGLTVPAYIAGSGISSILCLPLEPKITDSCAVPEKT